MGSLYKMTLGSMFETPIIAAARQNREKHKREDDLYQRELDLRERELELRKLEIELELMNLKMKSESKNIVNGLIYD